MRLGSFAALLFTAVNGLWLHHAWADVVTLPSGAQYEGSVQRIASVGDNPVTRAISDVPTGPIVLIDDELRFTMIPFSVDVKYTASAPKNVERIKIDQLVAGGSRRVGAVGRVLEITPWDEYGRRRFTMEAAPTGRLDVYQGITLITPQYVKVEGLHASKVVWDLRMATTSIAPATLRKVLLQAEGADPTNIDSRLRVVRLFIQAELYREAIDELEQIRTEFPELADTFKDQSTRLVQLAAQQFLRDITLRRDAGQHQHVIARLENFPRDDVAGETLIRVRDMLQEYDDRKRQYELVLEMFAKHLAELKDEALKAKLEPFHKELQTELNMHTINRMADYLRLGDDATMGADQKIALAISGFLLGSGSGIENLAVASSLIEVRDLVVKYLRSDLASERQDILEEMRMLEGSANNFVAKILEHMKPPIESQETEAGVPNLYELKTKGIEEQPEFSYYVQLPPEYHPSRRYPVIVTLNGFNRSELDQIDWWAGTYLPNKSMRLGQAWRRGYIVIAPRWQKPLQGEYEYSLREHAAVLFTLRDACRRISIDTDRVYLSGHVEGGDAAWDIALAHPDLWAGVILFTPTADRYVKHYSDNQRYVPMYFVAGEKDAGTAASGDWLTENASELNRYLAAPRSDCTVVLYRGRGRDSFSDEIHRIFDWMDLPAHRRNFAPRSFKVSSMRPWDNFFWWVELEGFPRSSMVLPHAWPERGTRATSTSAEIIAANGRITVQPTADRTTVYLTPDIADFSKTVTVAIGGKEVRGEIRPDLEVMLEDVRTRGDRQHPFWAKVEWPERK